MTERQSIIAQSSLTYAYRGEALLRSAGIRVTLIRLSGQRTQRGCGYGLSVNTKDLARSLSVLRSNGAFVGEILN